MTFNIRLAAVMAFAWAASASAAAPKAKAPKPEKPPTKINVKVGPHKDVAGFLADNKGKVVVIDFWATWCEPCKEMFPHLVAMHAKHWDDGLRVAGVSIDDVDKVDEVKDFATKNKAFFPIVTLDLGNDNWDTVATGINKNLFPSVKWDGGVPVTLVYGRDGKLIKAFLEKADEKTLDAVVEKALAEK